MDFPVIDIRKLKTTEMNRAFKNRVIEDISESLDIPLWHAQALYETCTFTVVDNKVLDI